MTKEDSFSKIYNPYHLSSLLPQIHNSRFSIEKLQTLIEQDKQNYRELTSNPEQLEKFARENYLMKKENEDIFIILPEN